MDSKYIILSNSLPFEESRYNAQTSQKLVRLLPLGLVHSTKGDFLVDNESFQSIRCKFSERQLQIPIDYEHQTLKDMQAPAAGWIKDIVLKSDGIYGAVDWTERAAEYLKNREYRYLSPVILTQGKERRVVALHSAALTNTPAIDAMTPIACNNKPSGAEGGTAPEEAESSSDSLEALAELLQLDLSATMEDIYKAVTSLLEGREALKLKADACQFEVTRMKADDVVSEALKDGKVLPFQRDWAFQSAMNDLDSFTLWLKSAPRVVPMGEVCPERLPQMQHHHSRAHELLGLSAEDIAKLREYLKEDLNMDFEKIGGHNAAVRGYILRMLVKGYRNALAVRRISNSLVRDGLVSDPDIWEPLKYLYDMGFIEFTNKKITPDNAYEQDGVVRLTTKGVHFIENGGDLESGIDL